MLKDQLMKLGGNDDIIAFIDDNFIQRASLDEDEVTQIRNLICLYLKIPPNRLYSKTRIRSEFVKPRQLTHYFARKYTRASYSTIGRVCGGVDHATVIHSCRTVPNDILTDNMMALDVSRIDRWLLRTLLNIKPEECHG